MKRDLPATSRHRDQRGAAGSTCGHPHFSRVLGLAAVLSAVTAPVPLFAQPVALVHSQLHRIVSSANVTAVQSGNWSDSSTWGGQVPGQRARVAIPAGITVTVDTEILTAYDWIRNDGTLRYRPDVNTRLVVETLVSMGKLEMGTEAQPIAHNVTARLVFRSNGLPFDHVADPLEIMRGLIAMSPVSIYGTRRQEICGLDGFPSAGATTVILKKTLDGTDCLPTGWQPGDELLINPTIYGQDETTTVTAISGQAVSFTPALQYPRTNVPRNPDGTLIDQRITIHVGHLTRNVIIQTDPSEAGNRHLQGHVMLMGGGHRIFHAAFLDTGRTVNRGMRPDERSGVLVELEGQMAVTDPLLLPDGTRDPQLMPLCGVRVENVRGRYALHFHNPGPASAPSIVDGVVLRVARSGGFKIGLQNHSAYVMTRNSIAHQFIAGFFTEEGDERGEFDGIMATHSLGSDADKGELPGSPQCEGDNYPDIFNRRRADVGGNGAGLWMQGSGNVRLKHFVFAGQDFAGFGVGTRGLDFRAKPNTFHILVRPDQMPGGHDWWYTAIGAPATYDASRPQMEIRDPPLTVSDGHIYAIGGTQRYSKGLTIGLELDLQCSVLYRPKSLFERILAWNVARGLDAQYSDCGFLKDSTFIAGLQTPGNRNTVRRGIDTRGQDGRFWRYENVRIVGFTPGFEFLPSDLSVIRNVTIDGTPYVPTIEACEDRVDNDNDGLADEDCPGSGVTTPPPPPSSGGGGSTGGGGTSGGSSGSGGSTGGSSGGGGSTGGGSTGGVGSSGGGSGTTSSPTSGTSSTPGGNGGVGPAVTLQPALVNGATVSLTWGPVGTLNVTEYMIEAGSASGLSDLYNGSVGTVTSLSATVGNGTYFVRVRARTSADTSELSNEVSFSIGSGACTAAAPTPTGVSGSVVAGLASVAWTQVPGATSYVVQAGSAPGLSDVFYGNVGANSFVSAAVGEGFSAYVRVVAVNACGQSAASAEILLQ